MFLLVPLLSFFAASIDGPTETVIFTNGDDGSKFYRITAIVRAKDGSLVTATDKRWYNTADLPEKIDVVIKRSTDNGKTWSSAVMISPGLSDKYGYGDASLVVDQKTGWVFCFFNGVAGFFQSTPENPHRQYYCISKDNGITWSKMTDITDTIYGSKCSHPDRKTWLGLFLTSGAALQLKSGRIMVIAVVRVPGSSGYHNYAIYTDDLGQTWNVGIKPACTNGDESKVVELNNGDVLMSIRHRSYRFFSISHDKGLTWDPYYDMKDLVDPFCNGEIMRYTSTKTGHNKDRLIHSILYHPTKRQNLTILVSYDEGKTWPVKKVLCAAPSVYSSLAFLDDGTIICYYERNKGDGFDMVISEFSLEWVTDGADKYEAPKQKQLK